MDSCFDTKTKLFDISLHIRSNRVWNWYLCGNRAFPGPQQVESAFRWPVYVAYMFVSICTLIAWMVKRESFTSSRHKGGSRDEISHSWAPMQPWAVPGGWCKLTGRKKEELSTINPSNLEINRKLPKLSQFFFLIFCNNEWWISLGKKCKRGHNLTWEELHLFSSTKSRR